MGWNMGILLEYSVKEYLFCAAIFFAEKIWNVMFSTLGWKGQGPGKGSIRLRSKMCATVDYKKDTRVHAWKCTKNYSTAVGSWINKSLKFTLRMRVL